MAFAGFYTFGEGVESDILNNYPKTDLVSVARFMIVLLVAFSYPLQAHPARKCALSLYASLFLGNDAQGNQITPGIIPFYAITTAFVLGSFCVSLAVTDLGVVLEMVGATGSTMVSYILPGAIYWKLHPSKDLDALSPGRSIPFPLSVSSGCGMRMLTRSRDCVCVACRHALFPAADGGMMQKLAAMQFCIGCCIVPVALWAIFQ